MTPHDHIKLAAIAIFLIGFAICIAMMKRPLYEKEKE